MQSRIVCCATSFGCSLGSQWQHPWYGAERNLLRLWLNSVQTAKFVIPSVPSVPVLEVGPEQKVGTGP